MACCCEGGTWNKKDPLVDAERLITEYAWREMIVPAYPWYVTFLRKQRYTMAVNWDYMDISHAMTKFRSRLNPVTKDKMCEVSRRDLVLFKTQFINETSEPQKFTFKTERQTKSSCHISIQKGLKVGGKVDLKFKLPTAGAEALANAVGKGDVQLCDVTGGLSMQMSLTKTTGHSVEETLTWSVDNEISAVGGAETTASLVVKEEELTADYTLDTTFRPLRGDLDIPVYLKDKKTGRVLEIINLPSTDLPVIFKGVPNFAEVPDTANSVRCSTKGTCCAVYGARQLIVVKSQGIAPIVDLPDSSPEELATTSDVFRITELPQEGRP